MPQLEVARSLEEIKSTLDKMMERSMPGLQIAPEVTDETAILIALGEGMQQYMPGFRFNVCYAPVDRTGIVRPSHDQGAHFDRPEALRRAGIAMHVNDGLGSVALALASPLAKDLGVDFLDSDLETIGPWYEGELRPRTKTVFSEGIQTDALIMGPAKHRFTSADPGTRMWRRYTFDINANETTPPLLGHHIPDNQAVC